MIPRVFIFFIILIGFPNLYGQEVVRQIGITEMPGFINHVNIAIRIDTKPVISTNNYGTYNTDLVYDTLGFLKSFYYTSGSKYMGNLDTSIVIRTYKYNHDYSYFTSSDQKEIYKTHEYGYPLLNLNGYPIHYQSFGRINSGGSTMPLFYAADAKGYSKIDSFVHIWNQLSKTSDSNDSKEPKGEFGYCKNVPFHIKSDFYGQELVDSNGKNVRCYLLLNLLTDIKEFYLPVSDGFWGIKENWLQSIYDVSRFLSFPQTSDYSNLGANLGRRQDSILWNIGYNNNTMQLKLNAEHKIKQALVNPRYKMDYYYKYAVYEYFGDSLIRINNYEVTDKANKKYYINNVSKNFDIKKLNKLKGVRKAVEELRFEHEKLISYKKKYNKKKYYKEKRGNYLDQECFFTYDPKYGLLSRIDYKILINPKLHLKESFTVQISYD